MSTNPNKLKDEFKKLRLLNHAEAEGILEDGTYLSDWWISKFREIIESKIKPAIIGSDFSDTVKALEMRNNYNLALSDLLNELEPK